MFSRSLFQQRLSISEWLISFSTIRKETIATYNYCNVGIIREYIPHGDGDFLLGFQPVDDFDPYNIREFDFVEYYKLSEIRLNRLIENNEEE